MSWTRLDDGWTDLPVFHDLDCVARWHYLSLVQWCSRNRLYDGVVRIADARRCSDVDDPQGALEALAVAGLVELAEGTVRLPRIVDHVPPPHMRDDERREAQRKRKSRERAHRRGDHGACLPESCPQAVTRDVTGDVGTGQDGRSSVVTSPPPPVVTRDVARDTEPKGQLGMVVVEALPTDLGQQLTRSTVDAVCRDLASRGWSDDDLGDAVRRRSWDGAGPGAVVTWLRDLHQPPKPPQAQRPTGARCPGGAPFAADGSCCGTDHQAAS